MMKKAKSASTKAVRPRIVAGAGILSAANASGDWGRAKRIEEAMAAALRQALAEGITDPKAQRDRMIAARDAVIAG